MLTSRYTIPSKAKSWLVKVYKIRESKYLHNILRVLVIFNLTLVNLIDYLLLTNMDMF